MKVINLGPGVAPAITAIPGGWRIAIGGRPEGIVVYDVDTAGSIVVTRTFPDGFGFPVLDGPWLGFKTTDADGSRARLINLASDERHTYDPTPGNFPLAIGQGRFAWQSGTGYAINIVALSAPEALSQPTQQGAPDGLAWIEPDGSVALVKDVRRSRPGLLNPSRCGRPPYTYIGEQPDLAPQWPLGMVTGTGGWLLGGQECNTPKPAVSADGQSYAIVTWGREGVRLVLLFASELAALPAPPTVKPIDPPPPPPEPIPMTGITDEQFATLERLRAALPATLTPEQIGAMLNEWAYLHQGEGCGLERKDAGTAAVQPRTGIHVWNGVRFIRDGAHFGQDVLSGASVGRATPVRGFVGPANPATFVAPVTPEVIHVPPVDPPLPVDPPPVVVPPLDLSSVLARLALIEEAAAARHLELIGDLGVLAAGLNDTIKKQKYQGKAHIFGQSVTFTMEPQP